MTDCTAGIGSVEICNETMTTCVECDQNRSSIQYVSCSQFAKPTVHFQSTHTNSHTKRICKSKHGTCANRQVSI